MTLVAYSIRKKSAFIMADLLISVPNKHGIESIPIPTLAERSIKFDYPATEYVPIGALQKVYIIDSKLCLVFAGSIFECKQLLRETKLHFKIKDITIDNVLAFFENYDKEAFKESSVGIIMCEKHKNNWILQTASIGTWAEFTTDTGFKYRITGSGHQSFFNIAQIPRSFWGIGSKPDEDEYTSHLIKSFTLIAEFLARELHTEETLLDYWGGGFEVAAFYSETGFFKFQNITYVIWNYKKKSTGEIDFHPNSALNFRYEGELLRITASAPMKGLLQEYICLPFDIEPDDVSSEVHESKISFNADIVCFCCIVEFPDGTTHYFPTVDNRDFGERVFDVWITDDGHTDFYLNDGFKNHLFEWIEKL